jgi:RNA polymerase sigma-70 factor, ECF subfamily
MNDRTLVARALAGDEQAFTELFDTYFPRLFRFALRRVGDEDAAEEVVQATLTRAMRSLGTWRGEASLLTWLCTICRHEVSAHWERAGRGPGFTLIDDLPEVRATFESLTDDERPDKALERLETAGAVQIVLDQLPGLYGDILEWKYAYGMTVMEIAQRIGSTDKAVESMLTRARHAFREGFSSL